ncbi:hypothetical protein Kim5_PA00013 (plasmid) [Rhizobium sp. Kim5]|nr:hypothetical protein Kim5_PA00013 [Rhizobium sp. Kim5]
MYLTHERSSGRQSPSANNTPMSNRRPKLVPIFRWRGTFRYVTPECRRFTRSIQAAATEVALLATFTAA